jgi:hypothetical protein
VKAANGDAALQCGGYETTALDEANVKHVDEALPLFARAFEMEPGWRELTPRLPHAGLLPDDAKLIERIVGARK